ncbi:hypothetical protein TrST_g4222 [Triparma strigata]|uniref:Uncharacterized protein n=1 Tax=Triparma strigata TaxID=1606541 RepID=A0A9W6ZLB9_9STRA|nr:hypothetical protein TrST_g4222 [Triparma strigata]
MPKNGNPNSKIRPNLTREYLTSSTTFFGILLSTPLVLAGGVFLVPELFLEGMEWGKGRDVFAVVMYRALVEFFITYLRSSYHQSWVRSHFIYNMHRLSMEFLLFFLYLFFTLTYEPSSSSSTTEDFFSSLASLHPILVSALITFLANSFDALAKDFNQITESIISAVIHLFFLPLCQSLITYFFVVILTQYLNITVSTIKAGLGPSGLENACEHDADQEVEPQIMDNSSEIESFLVISVFYPILGYAFLFFLLSPLGSSLLLGWGAYLKEEFSSQHDPYSLTVRVAHGIINLPTGVNMLRIFNLGNIYMFGLQVFSKVIFQSASKLIVYKADYNILKKLAKRDGTFEGSEDLNVEDYNGINDITKRIKKIQEAFFDGVTYSFDDEGNANNEKAKPDLNDKKDAYGRHKLPDSAMHLLGLFYKNNPGGNKPYKSVSVNAISVDLYFKSGGKKSAEQEFKSVARFTAFATLEGIKAEEAFSMISNWETLNVADADINKEKDNTILSFEGGNAQVQSVIHMPIPMRNRILIMNQENLEVPDGSYVVDLTESSMDAEELTQQLSMRKSRRKPSDAHKHLHHTPRVKRVRLIRGGYVIKPTNGGCRVMQTMEIDFKGVGNLSRRFFTIILPSLETLSIMKSRFSRTLKVPTAVMSWASRMGNTETWDTIVDVCVWYLKDKDLLARMEKAKKESNDSFLGDGAYGATTTARTKNTSRKEADMVAAMKKFKSDMQNIDDQVFKQIEIEDPIYKGDKCVADLLHGDLVCTLDIDADAADLASRFAYANTSNRRLHSYGKQGDTYWEEKRHSLNDDKSTADVLVTYHYNQVVSGFGSSGFIIRRDSLTDLPEADSKSWFVAKEKSEEEQEREGRLSNVKRTPTSLGRNIRRSLTSSIGTTRLHKEKVKIKQTMIIFPNSEIQNQKKSTIFYTCSLALSEDSTLLPMPPKKISSLHEKLSVNNIFGELRDIQKFYLLERHTSATRDVFKARNNVSKGSWKSGIDPYDEQDAQETMRCLEQYDYTRLNLKNSRWIKVEESRTIKLWRQTKKQYLEDQSTSSSAPSSAANNSLTMSSKSLMGLFGKGLTTKRGKKNVGIKEWAEELKNYGRDHSGQSGRDKAGRDQGTPNNRVNNAPDIEAPSPSKEGADTRPADLAANLGRRKIKIDAKSLPTMRGRKASVLELGGEPSDDISATHLNSWAESARRKEKNLKKTEVHMGYAECAIYCRPSLIKKHLAAVFDKDYDGQMLKDIDLEVVEYISDHSSLLYLKHNAAWPIASRDFLLLVTAKNITESTGNKDFEVFVMSISSVSESDIVPAGYDPREGVVRGSMQGTIIIREKISSTSNKPQRVSARDLLGNGGSPTQGTRNFGTDEGGTWHTGATSKKESERRRSLLAIMNRNFLDTQLETLGPSKLGGGTGLKSMLSGLRKENLKKVARDKSESRRSGGEKSSRRSGGERSSPRSGTRSNSPKSKSREKTSPQSKSRSKSRDRSFVPWSRAKGSSESDSETNTAQHSLEDDQEDEDVEEEEEAEAEKAQITVLLAVNPKGFVPSIYVANETKNILRGIISIKKELEITTLTAKRRTYKERIEAMNQRLAFKWNQENLIEKCCNIMAALVYVLEEKVAYEDGVLLNNPQCELHERLAIAVGMLFFAEFFADMFLARFANLYCGVDMTLDLVDMRSVGSLKNLTFSLIFVSLTYVAASVLSTDT